MRSSESVRGAVQKKLETQAEPPAPPVSFAWQKTGSPNCAGAAWTQPGPPPSGVLARPVERQPDERVAGAEFLRPGVAAARGENRLR